ncbi:hypothetical protein BT69DRAFT_1351601 [Atractiella rhizophila]|nr:hypothetical protein BT69DRAFT_1351601 [Atractiella rhizophila]
MDTPNFNACFLQTSLVSRKFASISQDLVIRHIHVPCSFLQTAYSSSESSSVVSDDEEGYNAVFSRARAKKFLNLLGKDAQKASRVKTLEIHLGDFEPWEHRRPTYDFLANLLLLAKDIQELVFAFHFIDDSDTADDELLKLCEVPFQPLSRLKKLTIDFSGSDRNIFDAISQLRPPNNLSTLRVSGCFELPTLPLVASYTHLSALEVTYYKPPRDFEIVKEIVGSSLDLRHLKLSSPASCFHNTSLLIQHFRNSLEYLSLSFTTWTADSDQLKGEALPYLPKLKSFALRDNRYVTKPEIRLGQVLPQLALQVELQEIHLYNIRIADMPLHSKMSKLNDLREMTFRTSAEFEEGLLIDILGSSPLRKLNLALERRQPGDPSGDQTKSISRLLDSFALTPPRIACIILPELSPEEVAIICRKMLQFPIVKIDFSWFDLDGQTFGSSVLTFLQDEMAKVEYLALVASADDEETWTFFHDAFITMKSDSLPHIRELMLCLDREDPSFDGERIAEHLNNIWGKGRIVNGNEYMWDRRCSNIY